MTAPNEPLKAKFKDRMLEKSSESITDFETIFHRLQNQIRNGTLIQDKSQLKAAKRLALLQKHLIGHDNHQIEDIDMGSQDMEDQPETTENISNSNKTQTKIRSKAQAQKQYETKKRIPRGIYLYGEVGTGKSLLMDTFFETTPMQKKRRVHFHSFLQEIHTRIHKMKKEDLLKYGRNFHVDTTEAHNPIYRVAMELSKEVKLLCFDEFQVTDVADALILSQLFSVLWANGTVMVATSNQAPENLYEEGLNRSYFLPFIDLLKRYCVVLDMDSLTDYRRFDVDERESFFFQFNPETHNVLNGDSENLDSNVDFDEVFYEIVEEAKVANKNFDAENENNKVYESSPTIIQIGYNRTLEIKQGYSIKNLICRFRFDDLCCKELGSSDFQAIASQFKIIMLERIPILTLKKHNEARRFITLIDELYEKRCCIVCSAEANPDDLFVDSSHLNQKKSSGSSSDDTCDDRDGRMFGVDVAQSNGRTTGELASVKELSFAFRRASSRLLQMSSRAWWIKNGHL